MKSKNKVLKEVIQDLETISEESDIQGLFILLDTGNGTGYIRYDSINWVSLLGLLDLHHSYVKDAIKEALNNQLSTHHDPNKSLN